MDAKWLTDFEKKVESAVAELQKLRKENAAQQTQIQTLQKDLKAAQASGASASGWETEREDVRKRVEKLSAELEKLL
jgi:predicted RNase H-like nuclease (RuvC/YqgF family)